MPITKKQRELRRKHIGASDSPAIFDVDPFHNIGDLYASKVYEMAERSNAAMDAGNRLEAPIIDWAAEQLGYKLKRNQYRVSTANPLFSANHDSLVDQRPESVEGKSVGILFPTVRLDLWGDPGTSQVPMNVMVQVQHQMYVSDLDVVHVAALLGGRGFQLYHVPRDAEIIGLIVEAGELFWQNHVVPQVPPDAHYAPRLATLRKIIRVPKKTIELPPEPIKAWEHAKAQLKAAKEMAEEKEAAMLALLGDAEGGDYGDPDKILTYLETQRKGYTAQPTTFRTPRLSKRQKLLETTSDTGK